MQKAIKFSLAHEHADSRDLILRFRLAHGSKRYDNGRLLGPLKSPRGGVNGLILKGGYIVAEWGDTGRLDVTYSVTKSYLSTLVGLAVDNELIRDVHDLVKDYVDDGFNSPHNAKITWHHLLQQTSEWDGTLWDKHCAAGNPHDELRSPEEPGTFFEYNDVRVNRLALSLLQVWRNPLPQILKKYVMDSIGASHTWRWYGYDNSWVTLDGFKMQSVSGGCHWGGGMWATTRDHARFGYLYLRRGKWKGKQLISERWIEMATKPGDVNPTYGYMWWLNKDKQMLPDAHEESYMASGYGGNKIWIDPKHDIVIVVRWLAPDCFNSFVKQILDALS
ncbi:MAG: serine hydrolase [Candidatus Bathyarchaeota archaeon]|nr:MAG: serine hydrolase [Candidatus Bathyarchaeota archaeon]